MSFPERSRPPLGSIGDFQADDHVRQIQQFLDPESKVQLAQASRAMHSLVDLREHKLQRLNDLLFTCKQRLTLVGMRPDAVRDYGTYALRSMRRFYKNPHRKDFVPDDYARVRLSEVLADALTIANYLTPTSGKRGFVAAYQELLFGDHKEPSKRTLAAFCHPRCRHNEAEQQLIDRFFADQDTRKAALRVLFVYITMWSVGYLLTKIYVDPEARHYRTARAALFSPHSTKGSLWERLRRDPMNGYFRVSQGGDGLDFLSLELLNGHLQTTIREFVIEPIQRVFLDEPITERVADQMRIANGLGLLSLELSPIVVNPLQPPQSAEEIQELMRVVANKARIGVYEYIRRFTRPRQRGQARVMRPVPMDTS